MAVIPSASDVDTTALGRGVLAGLVVVATATAVAVVVVDRDEPGSLGPLFFAVTILGFALAGASTARQGVALPYTHGALAGLVVFGLVQLGVVVISTASGGDGDVSIPGLVLNALLASSAGMIGAMLGTRGGRRGA